MTPVEYFQQRKLQLQQHQCQLGLRDEREMGVEIGDTILCKGDLSASSLTVSWSAGEAIGNEAEALLAQLRHESKKSKGRKHKRLDASPLPSSNSTASSSPYRQTHRGRGLEPSPQKLSPHRHLDVPSSKSLQQIIPPPTFNRMTSQRNNSIPSLPFGMTTPQEEFGVDSRRSYDEDLSVESGSVVSGDSSSSSSSGRSSCSSSSYSSSNNSISTGDSSQQRNRSRKSSDSSLLEVVSRPVQAADNASRQYLMKKEYERQKQRVQSLFQGRQCAEQFDERQHSLDFITKMKPPSPKRKHSLNGQRADYEMIIHPDSVEGTVEAAALHLHGGTGGRKTPRADSGNAVSSNPNSAIMSANAMGSMRKDSRDDEFYENMSYGDVEKGKADTNVTVSLEQGVTMVTANKGNNEHGDLWSTGVASAIVVGTASRYKKALCVFPHGRRVLLPIIMSILACALSIVTLMSCRFMTILPGEGNNQVFQVGPWSYLSQNSEYDGGEVCLSYPSDIQLDSSFMIARAASALAACLGGGLVLWTCTLTCIPYSRQSINGLGLSFFAATILQLMTIFFYLSENCKGGEDEFGNTIGSGYFGGLECKPNQDLVFCIAASALYLATGWIMYVAQQFVATAPGFTASEVYTWSAKSKASNEKKGILRTVEKCWTQIPDGSTLTATVMVERRKEKDGRIKTTHSIQTEILPVS